MPIEDGASGSIAGLVPARPSQAAAPSMRTIPSTDAVFAAFAHRRLRSLADASPAAFEVLLRRVFPRAAVRPSELAYASETVWYVYREGRWMPPQTAEWWLDPSLPRLTVDRDGFVTEASPSAQPLGEPLAGRHLTDFAVDSSLVDLLQVVAGGGTSEWTSTIQFRAGARIVVAEVHVEALTSGGAAIVVRPEAVDPGVDAAIDPAARRPTVACRPPRDRLFAAYVHLVLERMPAPTPDGLAFRLRRLYPDAHVRPLRQEAAPAWECIRDRRPPLPEGWWLEPDLPRVVVDRDSRIRSASPELAGALGAEIVGRCWQEISGGEQPDSMAATDVLFDLGTTDSAFVIRDAAGRARAFEAHVTVAGDLLTAVLTAR